MKGDLDSILSLFISFSLYGLIKLSAFFKSMGADLVLDLQLFEDVAVIEQHDPVAGLDGE